MQKNKIKVLSLVLGLGVLLSSMTVFAEDQDISSAGSAEVEVTAVVGSEFIVGIPTSVVIDTSTGAGSYSINVKGSLDPLYTLHVTPTDEDNETPGVNFNISKEGVLNGSDIRIDVTDPKTSFTYNEINMSTPYVVDCSLQAEDDAVFTAGTYSGVLSYNIALNTTP